MSINGYIEKMKKIQNSLLKFLEEKVDVEENYENLKKIIADQKITENKHDLKSFLRLLIKISNNHRRVASFIEKIERIFREIKMEIKSRFSNSEIFELFKSNKRILLFLIKEDLLKIDENIFSKITKEEYIKNKYPQYFSPEIKPFLTEEFIQKYQKKHSEPKWIEETIKEIPENFEKKRLEGENDNYMCELIRKQKTKDFIAFMNRKGLCKEGSQDRKLSGF